MKELLAGTIIGLVIGVYFMWVFNLSVNHFYDKQQQKIQKCEAELPRNQHCKITAVVVEQK